MLCGQVLEKFNLDVSLATQPGGLPCTQFGRVVGEAVQY